MNSADRLSKIKKVKTESDAPSAPIPKPSFIPPPSSSSAQKPNPIPNTNINTNTNPITVSNNNPIHANDNNSNNSIVNNNISNVSNPASSFKAPEQIKSKFNPPPTSLTVPFRLQQTQRTLSGSNSTSASVTQRRFGGTDRRVPFCRSESLRSSSLCTG